MRRRSTNEKKNKRIKEEEKEDKKGREEEKREKRYSIKPFVSLLSSSLLAVIVIICY